jgi:hypothetical protein
VINEMKKLDCKFSVPLKLLLASGFMSGAFVKLHGSCHGFTLYVFLDLFHTG